MVQTVPTIAFEPAAAFGIPTRAAEAALPERVVITARVAARPGAAAAMAFDTLATAVLAERGAPFRAGSDHLRGWFVITGHYGDGGEQSQPAAAVTGIVGSAFATRIQLGAGLPDLLLRRDGVRLQVALRATATADRTIAVLADAPLDDARSLRLFAARAGTRHGILFEIRVGGDPAAELLATARAAAATAANAPVDGEGDAWSSRLARSAIGADPRRRTLLAVADGHDLVRTTDLLLGVDEAALIAIADGLAAAAATDAFATERAIWQALLPAMERGEVTPATQACLRRHLGVLGLDPTSYEFVLATATTMAELETAIAARNFDGLDARRAGHRVTAAAWLRRNGRALDGYDPLAARAERRAVLRRLEREGER